MESTDIDTNGIQTAEHAEPDPLQAYCASGKSVADLAHLVKNIIQMVSGSVEIMDLGLQRKQYDRVMRSWDIFEPNFIRLKKFVMDLIKFTKQYPLQKSSCEFSQLIQKAIASCEPLLKRKHVKVRIRQDKAIPPAELDADRVEEIVVNLLLHAFDNITEPVGEILLCTHWLADRQQIQLVVTDDGPLLSRHMREQYLEPFERTRTMAGTGFEIPLAIRYVQQHNGYLELGGDEDGPNTVCAYLPCP